MAAEGAYRNALTLEKQLAANFPAVPEYRHVLAGGHNGLGILLASTGRLQDAERAFRDALTLSKQLAADFPTVLGYRDTLAGSYGNLGNLLVVTGRPKEAETAFREAMALQKGLAKFPAVPEYQIKLSGTLYNLGNLLRDRKAFDAARRMYEEAIVHNQAALKANPRHSLYRQLLRNSREALCQLLVDLGEYSAAGEAASQLMEAAVNPADDFYNAACFLARCARLAEKDQQLSEAKRKERGQSYGDKAIATLRRAIQSGYKDAPHMKKDTDLDALRGRDDFKKVLADLEANAKPLGK
jgi:tetratricopeptide (TPR) repeat protein